MVLLTGVTQMKQLKPISLALFFAFTSNVFAQQEDWGNSNTDWGDDWADEQVSPWQFAGFTELARGQFTQGNIVNKSQSLNELRLRLDTTYSQDGYDISLVGDAYYDQVLEDLIWQTRELNIAFSPIANLDLKLGRQVMTWGTGDYLFLNDLFSKDWQSFFSGREDEFLKAPSDAARFTYYFDDYSLDFAYTPDFTPDNYLTGERFSFYSPAAHAQIAPADYFQVNKTDKATYAIKLATTVNSIELAAYGYKGYWTNPYGVDQNGEAYFPELYSYGFSARAPLAAGLINAEFAKYNSLEDPEGQLANIANDQLRFLLGYEQELVKNVTLGVQYYVEKTEDYHAYRDTHYFPHQLVDKYRQMATLRLTHRAMQQTLTSSLFLFWSPTDKDGYLKPSINYRYNDNWSIAAGGNIFFGAEDYTFWGQHQKNTNIWLRARYSF